MRTYISVSLDDFDEEDIIEYLKGAGYSVQKPPQAAFDEAHDELLDLYDYLKCREYGRALLLLEGILFPKWKSAGACLEQWKRERGRG